jgi:hypothetical protein
MAADDVSHCSRNSELPLVSNCVSATGEVIQAAEEGCLGLRFRVHAADAQAECAVLSGRALPSALLDMCMSETGLANDYG